uniref:Exocyst complex component Sec10-like alpha-helical bundle domain-containing protein n=1 Tax=Glossina pallidipes TaxID=7398 RepID=A0A1B0A7H6_GLOPL
MKKLGQILSQFKGQCINTYIEQSRMSDIGIVPMCKNHYEIIKKVFAGPQQVMSKFILNFYQLKLHQYAMTKLEDKRGEDKYLKTLYEFYSRRLKLSCDLQIYMSTMDDDLLNKLTQQIFQKHIFGYVEIESRLLTSKCFNELEKLHLSKKHQKKQIERFQELKRDMQVLIGTRANINIAQIEDYGGETFLSEELAIKILQKANATLKRSVYCVATPTCLRTFLIHEHVNYALEVGLHAVPIVESTGTLPHLYFLDVVHKTSIIVHFNTPKCSDYLFKKRILMEQLESKFGQGLDRTINAVIGWVKFYLQHEQRKTDYKPDIDVDTISSAVRFLSIVFQKFSSCLHVVQSLQPIIQQLKICVDDENQKTYYTNLSYA